MICDNYYENVYPCERGVVDSGFIDGVDISSVTLKRLKEVVSRPTVNIQTFKRVFGA